MALQDPMNGQARGSRGQCRFASGESRDTHNLMVTETHPTLPRTVLTSATTRLFTQSLDLVVFRSIPRSGGQRRRKSISY